MLHMRDESYGKLLVCKVRYETDFIDEKVQYHSSICASKNAEITILTYSVKNLLFNLDMGVILCPKRLV